jgi:hypothetical protein
MQEMNYYEYVEKMKDVAKEKETIAKEREAMRAEEAFSEALDAAGYDASWAKLIKPASRADISRIIAEMKAKGVPLANQEPETLGKRLGRVEREANERAASVNYFGGETE